MSVLMIYPRSFAKNTPTPESSITAGGQKLATPASFIPATVLLGLSAGLGRDWPFPVEPFLFQVLRSSLGSSVIWFRVQCETGVQFSKHHALTGPPLSPLPYSCLLCGKFIDLLCVGLFPGYSFPGIHMSVFMAIPYCFDFCSTVYFLLCIWVEFSLLISNSSRWKLRLLIWDLLPF